MRACANSLENLMVRISRIIQPIELEFNMELKLKCCFLQYNFCHI